MAILCTLTRPYLILLTLILNNICKYIYIYIERYYIYIHIYIYSIYIYIPEEARRNADEFYKIHGILQMYESGRINSSWSHRVTSPRVTSRRVPISLIFYWIHHGNWCNTYIYIYIYIYKHLCKHIYIYFVSSEKKCRCASFLKRFRVTKIIKKDVNLAITDFFKHKHC